MTSGVSLVVRDLQGLLLVYRKGYGSRQIKADPGVLLVYAGFGLLMVGVVMSYVSHSQIWALQSGDRFFIGGKTNRAHLLFERELVEMIEQLTPEAAPPEGAVGLKFRG